MKRIVTLIVLGTTSPLDAQNFSFDWFTIDGGGGRSSHANYALNGSIGQPDAGTLSGGSFTLHGGFWSGVVTEPMPQLLIQQAGSHLFISWSPAIPGFVLQESESLWTESWVAAPTGSSNPASVPRGSGTKFYRLVSQ